MKSPVPSQQQAPTWSTCWAKTWSSTPATRPAATPDAVQGESLIPVAQGVNGGYPRPAIASQYELAHTMRLGAFKLWVGGSGQIELLLYSERRLFELHSPPAGNKKPALVRFRGEAWRVLLKKTRQSVHR